MRNNVMKLAITTAMVFLFGLLAAALTADEILDRMQEEGETFMGSGVIMTSRIENDYGGGITAPYAFHVLAETDHILIYFFEPADWMGVIFLFVEDEDEEGEMRVWQYLPALGEPKELDAEGMEGSFAGSSMSIGDVARDDWRDDYDAVLLGEETLTIAELERTVYVLELTAKADADVDDVVIKMWIDTEHFTDLKAEYYNDLGNVRLATEAIELTEFDGRIVARIQRQVDSEVTTTTVMEYRRPDVGDFPDEVFSSESITIFDPSEWGL